MDTKQRQLWLIRDRIGVKPLYYSIHHGRITFASEIKALLEDEQQPRDVNEEALYYYLSFNATPAPLTLFSGIQKLAPGTWLRVNEDGHVQECRYWDVWITRSHLTNVPRRRLPSASFPNSALPLSSAKSVTFQWGFLSGGIDSSTNAALFSEGDGQPVKTFSIGYDREYESYPSELGYARKIAQKVGADHHELLLKEATCSSLFL